jgi:hypothetical protein
MSYSWLRLSVLGRAVIVEGEGDEQRAEHGEDHRNLDHLFGHSVTQQQGDHDGRPADQQQRA